MLSSVGFLVEMAGGGLHPNHGLLGGCCRYVRRVTNVRQRTLDVLRCCHIFSRGRAEQLTRSAFFLVAMLWEMQIRGQTVGKPTDCR
jgi:hypothetical protein